MRRLFWLGIGVAAGVAITRKLNQAAKQATPIGIAGNLSGALGQLAEAIGAFGADVRAGMTEREDELSKAVERSTGVDVSPRHALRAANQVWQDSAARPARQLADARARRAGG